MAAVDDQYPVEQFAADSSNPSFGDRVRLGCPHRGAQDANTLAREHGIENAGERAVPVPDQHRELSCAVSEVHQKVPRLLGHPGAAGVSGDSEEVDASRVFHHQQHGQPLQQQRLDAEEVGGQNAPGLAPAGIAARWARRGEERDRCRLA